MPTILTEPIPTAEELANQGRASIARKVAEIMAAVSHVEKRGRNAFHNYDYATEADVVAAIRNEMASRNLVLIPAVTGWEEKEIQARNGVDQVVHARMTMTFVCGDTGAKLVFQWAGAGLDRGEKGLYKAMTGGEKYFLLKTFLLPTGDDPERDDAQGASTQVAAPTVAAGRSPTSPRSDMASSTQINMIWARGKQKGLTEDEIKQTVKVKAGVDHVAEIPKAKVDAVLQGLDEYEQWKATQTEQPQLPVDEKP
jgi:hypothetical protein